MAKKQSKEEFINRLWYGPRSYSHYILCFCLLPLTVIYGSISIIRRYLYRFNIFASHSFTPPVIVIGNLTVGGTGKTPLTIAIAEYLLDSDLRVGVVSRGYGNKSQESDFPLLVKSNMLPHQCGDEPLLIKRNLPNIHIVVDPQRARGARFLVDDCHCDVIICDDGLQHYALARDLEVVVVDASRRFGNGLLLPAGPLRESLSRLKHSNFVVLNTGSSVQVGVSTHKHNPSGLVKSIEMRLSQGMLVNLKTRETIALTEFIGKHVHLIAGIGNPDRFFNSVEALGIKTTNHVFPDHYNLTLSDVMFVDNVPVIMTEKDAVKLQNVEQNNLWYLPIKADLPAGFMQLIHENIKDIAKNRHKY